MSESIYKAEVVEVEALAVDAVAAAKLIGVCETTLRKLAKHGQIPHKRVCGRLLFPVHQLREWLANPEPVGA